MKLRWEKGNPALKKLDPRVREDDKKRDVILNSVQDLITKSLKYPNSKTNVVIARNESDE